MTAAKKPAKPTTVSGSASLTKRLAAYGRWREQYNPLRGLTLARAVTLGESYFRGDMADLQWTYFFIEGTDADLLALIEMRFGRLLEMEYDIHVTESKEEKLAKEQQQYLKESLDLVDNLYEGIEHLGMAAFRGFSHCEKFLNSSGELEHLEIVDQWNAVRDGLNGPWKYNPEARSTTFRALPEENLMRPENFLFRQVRRPINRIALLKAVRSSLSDKDWDAFNEIYGIPSGVVIGPATVPPEKENEYKDAAETIAEGGSGYLPYGSQYTPNDSPRGTQPFKARLDHLSEKLVLVGTGGRLTMLNGPTGLGGGQSEVHQDVFEQIAAGEARRISEIFNKQLVAEMLTAKFPGQPQLAYFKLAANEETDVGAVVEHITKLKTAGYVTDVEEVKEKTGYEVTLGEPMLPPGPAGGQDRLPPRFSNRIRNRQDAASAGRLALFTAESQKRFDPAVRSVVLPILEKLAQIAALTDLDAQRAALKSFLDESPTLFKEAVARVPAAAEVLQEIIGTAAISGFAESAKAKAEPAQTG